MVLGVQIAGFLFGIFMVYYSFLNYKRKEFTIREFGFWIVLWAVFVIVAMFPSVLDPIAKELSFFRTLDLLVITGLLFLITSTFYIYTLTRKTQKRVEMVVREMALKKSGKK